MGQVMTRTLTTNGLGIRLFWRRAYSGCNHSSFKRKIEDDPSHPEYIVTRRGVGYFLQQHD